MNCTVCNKRSYSEYCVSHKPRKPIAVTSVPKRSKWPKQIGKGTQKYNEWRDTVARPYLIAQFGRLKMILSNVQLICRPHHRQKTDNVKETV
jgi:hypothetical protein